MSYPDVEALLVSYLSQLSQLRDISVRMPNSPALPFGLVTRVSGSDDYVTDRPVVDVEVFDADRTTSYTVAAAVHEHMLKLRRARVDGSLVDHVEVITGPRWVDYQDEGLQRHLASYRIEFRAS